MNEPLLSLATLARALRGPFNFLRPDAQEIVRLLPEGASVLPLPQRIYLADEAATPLLGYPILLGPDLVALKETLGAYIRLDEEVQVRIALRQSHDAGAHQGAWEAYRALLARASENVTTSSYGRRFPDIFWLCHSLDVARLLKETPRRVSRFDATVGRERGGALKYQVFFRYLDRVLSLTYDLVNRLAADTEEVEQELFPSLLARMRDNVLVFTEDHISHDLAELSTYFQDHLHIDGRDLRYRLAKLGEWHTTAIASDARLQASVRHLVGVDPRIAPPRDLLRRQGYVSFLAAQPDYDGARFLSHEQVLVWEHLLTKLKEFELFHALRRLAVPVQVQGGRLYFRERSLNRTWAGSALTEVSSATRPLDFMAPWVVDPLVSRFGMIYDITDFSHTISMLRRSGQEIQDSSFRQMFRFQRRINRQAGHYRLKLEKYLGDGAFYSAREAWRLVVAAIQVQRFYRQAILEGFPFDRGLRIALNHGEYRLLPIQGANPGEPERYEFFGHGVVELSRLTTGKTMREIEEIKILLINLGYPEQAVHRFFAPLAAKDMDVVDRGEEKRDFYAYINRNGKLVNEGIVATERFVTRLGVEQDGRRLYRLCTSHHGYVALPLDTSDGRLVVAVRKLGIASLKGLEPLPVYEIVDGGTSEGELADLDERELMPAVAREYAQGLAEAPS